MLFEPYPLNLGNIEYFQHEHGDCLSLITKYLPLKFSGGKIGHFVKHLDNIHMLIIHKLSYHYLNGKHFNFYFRCDAIIPNLMNQEMQNIFYINMVIVYESYYKIFLIEVVCVESDIL